MTITGYTNAEEAEGNLEQTNKFVQMDIRTENWIDSNDIVKDKTVWRTMIVHVMK